MRLPLLWTLGLLCLVGFTFAWRPELDLAAAHLFYDAGGFVGRTPAGEAARFLGWIVPFVVFGLAFIGWIARRTGLDWPFLPRGRTVFYLAATLTLGPGLLVNVVLKDNSHRPRPVQTTEFGGTLPFRPWNALDGGCRRNCSFVSGEASSATWLVAAALLAPPTIRSGAVVGALFFGGAVGLLRMAFGGHFLSDTLLSMLLTLLVVMAGFRWYGRQPSKSDPSHDRLPT